MKPCQRRKAMQSNRGRTRPERSLASGLWKQGLRYFTAAGYKMVSKKLLAGSPDLVFPSKRVVIFVDGCFWHGCPICRRVPPDMSDSWLSKIRGNVDRDRRVDESLSNEGWIVIRIPEHAIKTRSALEGLIDRLSNYLREGIEMGPFTVE